MARRISDQQRYDSRLKAEDARLAQITEKIEACKRTLATRIAEVATQGKRELVLFNVDESDLSFTGKYADLPNGFTCEPLQNFSDYLSQQQLLVTIGSRKEGYGVYTYYLEIKW